jgi:hypothetical protein
MLRLFAACALVLLPTVARADDVFDERQVCTSKRVDADGLARAVAEGPINNKFRVERVEQARRDLAAAKKWRDKYKRELDEAVADLEAARAQWRQVALKRDEAAKALGECVVRERAEFDARVEARRVAAQEKADAESKRRERVVALVSDRPTMQVALSAMICVETVERAAALREIAAEKKYARVGGVQNNSKLYELQRQVRSHDERKLEWQKGLKVRKLKALGCALATVRPVVECILQPVDAPSCAESPTMDPFDLAKLIEDRGLPPITPAP